MLITANNIVGGGDSWVVDSTGAPEKKILTTGKNTVNFTIPSAVYGYVPYVNTAVNTDPPTIKSIKFTTATNLQIVTNAVTQAQMGGAGGTDAYIQLRIVK